jgi:hypothetical protein
MAKMPWQRAGWDPAAFKASGCPSSPGMTMKGLVSIEFFRVLYWQNKMVTEKALAALVLSAPAADKAYPVFPFVFA